MKTKEWKRKWSMSECKSERKITEIKIREWKRKLNKKEIHPRNENDSWANEKKREKNEK